MGFSRNFFKRIRRVKVKRKCQADVTLFIDHFIDKRAEKLEMQFFIILLILGSCAMLTWSRPARLEETNDSDTAEAEYEENDDTAADDYLHEDQESTADEAQQSVERREDDQQQTQNQGEAANSEVASAQQPAQDKYGYESILTDNESGTRTEREHKDSNTFKNEKEYRSLEKVRLRKSQISDKPEKMAPDDFYSRSHFSQKDALINARSLDTNPEYGEMLFKIKSAQTNRQHNNRVDEAGDQSRVQQYYNNMHSKTKEHESENSVNYERDRRHIQNVDKQSDSTRTSNDKVNADVTNENSENTILRNIKKLSEQDLEELLNSLPDDKKELLKKIMEKREITKKAGAVDESSYLEGQPDTSKLEGGFSVDSNTESSIGTSDTSKQPENSDNLSSKSPDNDSGSRGSGSKSEIINNSDVKSNELAVRKESDSTITNSKNDLSIISESQDISKNEKRETNNKDSTNEKISSEDLKSQDIQLGDLSVNEDDLCSENEDWIDTKLNEPKESHPHSDTSKREISQKEQISNQDSIKSLEESFPAANSYEDNNIDSEMAPLIRVKRTEKDHHIKKRDSSESSNVKAHNSPKFENEYGENEGKREYENYSTFGRGSNLVNNNQEAKSGMDTVSAYRNTQRRYSQFDRSDSELRPATLSRKQDQISLGSDTDIVLSGIEGIDDNLMYNTGSRGKRIPDSLNDNSGKIVLNRSCRTVGPMNDVVPDNSINAPQYQEDEAFGPVPKNSEVDLSRIKRVRQVKEFQK